MNFQELADKFDAPTCVISVEKKQDGGYGDIRIVAGNEKYIEPIVHPVPFPGMPENFSSEFIPNSPYEKYLPKDIGFEDICYRSAVLKLPIHTFVHMNYQYIDIWFDIFAMPLGFEDGSCCYCVYTTKPSNPAELGISSHYSGGTAEDVLKTCIRLHGSDDLKNSMNEIIRDIRNICKAEVCTIMLMDNSAEKCSVLSTSYDKNSSINRLTQFRDFYDIAASWVDMIGASDCFIIKTNDDMEFVKMTNRPWYDSLRESNVESVVLFPLRYNNELLGYIWATNFDTNNTMRIKETLELTTFFISSEIASYNLVERLKHLSYIDTLTSLPNRFASSDHVNELIKRGSEFTLVSVDINGFKSINDTMGFDTGNKVLVKIVSRWKKIAENGLSGTSDTVYRLSGDEFAIIISGCYSDKDIIKTIKMYESALENRLTIDECDFYITAGFGYANYPTDARNTDSLLSYADAAMLEVKRVNSSDHILHFTPDLLKIKRTLEVERKIREALENDTVFFNLQPQYDMSHKLRGFEALARMKDDEDRIISPAEFIPVAEKVGLIDKVDEAVFRKSANFLGSLLKDSDLNITLSVNVSVRHLMKNDFLDEVRDILERSGLSADNLEIEITESIMIDSAEKALRCIENLRKMGIKIAIDDFGTGYSSLSYLNKFPANLLKIDKSFIDKMNSSESSKKYVAAIISIGHIMNFDVIAEGVEETEQLETLKSIGCDFIQGYIWGRPLPREEAEKLVMDAIAAENRKEINS